MKHKFLIVTQYFPPEIGGGSQRSVGFAEELSTLGMDIKVITPFPSYLMNKNEVKTKLKLFEKQNINGLEVYRTFVFASDRGNFLKRMMYYLSFTFSASIVALFELKKINFVLTISPPLFTGIVGLLIKKIKRAKFIFDIGDLWPESAVQLGFLTNQTAIKLAEKLERKIYREADFVNVVTNCTREKLLSLHPYIKKLSYTPNFVNLDVIKKREKPAYLLDELNIHDRMIFGYAGNIGGAQGLKIITEAAKKVKESKNITFLILGDGVEKDLIENEITKYDLVNVKILPPVKREIVADYIALFDVMIIPLVKKELFTITIPSKLYESMAAEIPVLLAVDGEARRIMEKYNCGIFIEPENSSMLAEKVLELSSNPQALKQYGTNGRKGAEEEFARKKVINNFFNTINCE
jgi:glycosyltransferase involved in cell wall biosynthesis